MDGNLSMANHLVFAKEHDFEEQEIWKDIPNYEGMYKISSFGRIKSLRNNIIIKQPKNFRYSSVSLCKNGKVKTVLVHRLVAFAFIENIHNKPHVNHIDGNKLNNHYSNLEWCTQSENQNHAYKLGLQKISNKHKIKVSNHMKNLWKFRKENGIELNYSEEMKHKSGERAKKLKIRSKKVINILTGEIHNSAVEAATSINMKYKSFNMRLLGKIKQEFNFKYL